MKVLFLTQTGRLGASSRYRVYQFLELLKLRGIDAQVVPGLEDRFFPSFYGSTRVFLKLPFLFRIIFNRLRILFRVKNFDIIFIQREILPQCFPVFEKIIKMLNKNIVFDFDDAIFLVPPQRKSKIYSLRYRNNLSEILRLSRAVIAGNKYLSDYARKFNPAVSIIPTGVDTEKYTSSRRRSAPGKPLIIGWIGSPHTIFYLQDLEPMFQALTCSKEFFWQLFVVGAKDYAISGVNVRAKIWQEDGELSDLRLMDIGIAPQRDDEWGKGKCGLKALLYMSCGIPVVCADTGVYRDFIIDGVNGFLAANLDQWQEKIQRLCQDPELRSRIGQAGRKTVEENYSRKICAGKLADVLCSIKGK